MPYIKAFVFIFFFALFFNTSFSQTNISNNEKSNYIAFDSVVGFANSGLYNGKRYIDRFRSSKDNHRFFRNYNFSNGYVLYNNQPYFNVSLKYDLFEDVLIAKPKGDKKFFNMVFISQQLKEFKLHGSHFVNINNYTSSNDILGFAELLFEKESIVLLKKHFKEKKDKIKEQLVTHNFKPATSYLVSNRDVIVVIKSKRDFKEIFPNKMDVINEFYKDNKSLNDNNPDLFMIRLSELINTLN